MLTIGKTFEFAACHRLFRPEWDQEKNLRVFGKCANPRGHGHNYLLEVSVAGEVDLETGMIIDAAKLEALVEEHILIELDHKNLDEDVPWLEGQISTVENLTNAIWERLVSAIELSYAGHQLSRIRIWETSRIFAEKSRSA